MPDRGRWGMVNVRRGQLATTLRSLAEDWRWPKSNVDRFLKRLKREGMIDLETVGTKGGTSGRALAHPVTIITICNYDKFQRGPSRYEDTGQEPGQQSGQAGPEMQPSPVFDAPKPNQHPIRAKSRERTKPPHGATGRGMVWLDYGTDEWKAYAADFKEKRGAEKVPENRAGGRGNWFRLLGEALGRGD